MKDIYDQFFQAAENINKVIRFLDNLPIETKDAIRNPNPSCYTMDGRQFTGVNLYEAIANLMRAKETILIAQRNMATLIDWSK